MKKNDAKKPHPNPSPKERELEERCEEPLNLSAAAEGNGEERSEISMENGVYKK